MKIKTLEDLEAMRNGGLRSLFPEKTKIVLEAATCGLATGAGALVPVVEEESRNHGLDVVISRSGCIGFCQVEPLVEIRRPGWPRLLYEQMDPEKMAEAVKALARDEIVPEWILCKIENGHPAVPPPPEDVPEAIRKLPTYRDIPFFRKQVKIALRNCGLIDPESLDEYIAAGGYFALHKALTRMTPEEVLEEVKKANLRGRGGGGFAAGRKWESCRKAEGWIHYVICNADEGDPGAYMDRSILEGDPHSVLEGMIIGAYAIGSPQGYVYVRHEYPQAVKHLRKALTDIKECGLLGEDIFGSGFTFDIQINRGGGAFVCGESTALMASLEGRVGEPRAKYIHTVEHGLYNQPSNLNNVETWANVPQIIDRGSDWFTSMGTEGSKGTKVFSLVGKINNTGLVEVPYGLTLREIIYDIGGGIPEGKAFKAVQTGGPSGGCLPEDKLDLLVDFDDLWYAGSMMGSGGMIVMDESTCVVDVAKYFLDFLQDESCGKCVPCREGVGAMLRILNRITGGEGEEGDVELLEELSEMVVGTSLCALGGSAPNPVLSTIKYFRDEYNTHVREKRCPAMVCKRLTPPPCQMACPIGQDVSTYVALIARGQYKEAFEIILKDNPFPGICGRVCNHGCEFECKRGELDRAIAIRSLKRFVADGQKKMLKKVKKVKPTYEEKVAVIGAGPAGLSAARDLALLGYPVTVFEALPVAGGMMVTGIPEFRLPRDVMAAEIKAITRLGVTIQTGTVFGKDVTFESLRSEGYRAFFVAVGAHKGLKLGIAGEGEYEGVVDCVELLREANLGEKKSPGDRVAVIGGGNAAVDAARVSQRLGAKAVTILYRRSRKEMPAQEEEIEEAEEEGVKIHYLAQPIRIHGENGRVTGVECIRMKLGEPDTSGRRRPIPIEGSEFFVETDAVIPAISQEPDLSFLDGDHGFEITRWSTFMVDPTTLETTVPGVFAGGDAVTGPATVVEAIAAGQRAAVSIHNHLRPEEERLPYKWPRPRMFVEPVELTDEMEGYQRPEMPRIPIEERTDFVEVDQGFAEEVAKMEACRCLRCDLE
jgi:NADH-quinone oxidoreductase subunit F